MAYPSESCPVQPQPAFFVLGEQPNAALLASRLKELAPGSVHSWEKLMLDVTSKFGSDALIPALHYGVDVDPESLHRCSVFADRPLGPHRRGGAHRKDPNPGRPFAVAIYNALVLAERSGFSSRALARQLGVNLEGYARNQAAPRVRPGDPTFLGIVQLEILLGIPGYLLQFLTSRIMEARPDTETLG